jgi:hypothetical protein
VGSASIRGWLPGRKTLRESFRLPADLRPGRYQLALGVVHPATKAPAVRLAISGRSPDGWYPLSELTLRS